MSNGGVAIIDKVDLELVSSYQWHRYDSRRTSYAMASTQINGKQKIFGMHRLLMGTIMSRIEEVDHKDGNGLNNRRKNLRLCTHRQNCQNTKIPTRVGGKSSRFKGVSWSVVLNLWHAYITEDGRRRKRTHLGYFELEEDAAIAYDLAARQAFGEFAGTNFKVTPTKIPARAGSVCRHGVFMKQRSMFSSKCDDCYKERTARSNAIAKQKREAKM